MRPDRICRTGVGKYLILWKTNGQYRTLARGGVTARRLPVGAECQNAGGVHFRIWAPAASAVSIQLDDGAKHPLEPEANGYFAALIPWARVGTRYRFKLDTSAALLPDPASRFQPDGPHGSSQVVDAASYPWSDAGWHGVKHTDLVIYELHVGTFTREGTWVSAIQHLPALTELGITCIEMMPVADFPGRFGWGYDGVSLFAPTRLYGRPDDLRRFIDRAHALGIAVILDVVYNHLGPDGNYLPNFSPDYFTDRYANEWGQALNFDGPNSGPVREFFIANAGYWIDEFHFDGLRLDATQQIFDASPEHLVAAVTGRIRSAAGERISFVVAENEAQEARLVRDPERGGYGLDAMWNDDFHHSAQVALTGRSEAYYSDYDGSANEFVALARHGFLFQGQGSAWQQQPRGNPALDLKPLRFVTFLQNHDQVANSLAGTRGHLLTSPGRWRALTACVLLGPGIPMLFQGQEFSAATPFLFFADHGEALGKAVAKGRREFLSLFPSLVSPEMQAAMADPTDGSTFDRCILDHSERDRHREAYALHQDLLSLRRELKIAEATSIDAARLGHEAWLVRYSDDARPDRLLLVNLGRDIVRPRLVEPLLAPVEDHTWRLRWTSESLRYGGSGTPAPLQGGVWHVQGHAALLLVAERTTCHG
jgi:maltooligosyltrehalose trehalohydrolase